MNRIEEPGRGSTDRGRIFLVVGLLIITVAAHWLTPTNDPSLNTLHLVLRKMLFLPVVVAAIWFGLRGSLLTAATATVLYLPHVAYQWAGRTPENLNQLGEIVGLWLVAAVVGVLATKRERADLIALESHRGALVALMSAIDARQRGTERHSLRVMAFSERLGEEMGLKEPELHELRIAALLHDLGKISFTDEMLLGSGAVGAPERALVQDHPALGGRILRWVPSLEELAEVGASHHERYDGRGYPRGLAGTQIPLHARIVSVADCFDAMTSGRPHQAPIELTEALDSIDKKRGAQFDPLVAEALLRIPEEDLRRVLESKHDARAIRFPETQPPPVSATNSGSS